MTSAPHYTFVDRGNHFLMSRADPWSHHFEYERQLSMEHGAVLWFDISKHDKRVHRTVVRRLGVTVSLSRLSSVFRPYRQPLVLPLLRAY